jgi:hypothetical protein
MAIQERYFNAPLIERVHPVMGITFTEPDLKGYPISWADVVAGPSGPAARRFILAVADEAVLDAYNAEPGVAEIPEAVVLEQLNAETGRPWSSEELHARWKIG